MSKKLTEKGISKHIAAFIETVCCYLFSIAAFILSRSLIGIDFPLKSTIIYPAVILLCLYVLTRKWWIITSAVGISLVGSAIFATVKRALFNKYFTAATLFFKWWFYDTALPEGWDETQALHTLYLITYIAICVAVYAIIIPFRKNWTALIFAVCILVLGCCFCRPAEALKIMILLLVGFFPLLSDKAFLRKMFGRNSKEKIKSAVAAMLIIGIVCSLIVLTFTKDTSKYHYRPCSDAVVDLHGYTKIFTDNEEYHPDITLETLGLKQANNKDIGGKIERDKGYKAVAELYDDQSRLWKITTFDTFNGSNWKHNVKDNAFYRINGPFKEEQTDYLSFNPAVTSDATFDKLFKKSRIGVVIPFESQILCTADGMHSFKENSESNNTVIFNSSGEVLSPWKEHKGYSYSLSAYSVKDLNTFLMKDAVTEFDSMAEKYKIDCPKELYKTYTQLPGFWSSYISKRTGSVKAPGTMQTVLNAYLFMHSLAIKITDSPNEKDGKNYSPIDKMIYNKSGNSVQYATAMCLILRDCGIPSRLAAGFRSIKSSSSNKYYLFTKNATVWVEVFIPGFGWLGIDIVPSNTYSVSDIPQKDNSEEPDKKKDDKKDDTPIDKENKDKDKENNTAFLSGPIVKGVAVLLILSVFVLIVRILLSFIIKSNKFARFMYPTPEGLYIFYYKDMLSAAKYLDIECTLQKTMRCIENEVFEDVQIYGIEDCFDIAERIYYDNYVPTDTEIFKIKKISEAADQAFARKKNSVTCFIKRKLFRPLTFVPKYNRFTRKKNK